MNKRHIQVAEEIKQIVSVLLQRELKDPRIGFTTVTEVRVTPDLKYSRIFVSVMGTPEEQTATMQALTSGRGFIRRELASRMEIRFVPEIQFRLDRGAAYSVEINNLLNEVKAADAERVVMGFGEDPGAVEDDEAGDSSAEASEAGDIGAASADGQKQPEPTTSQPDEDTSAE